MKVTTFVFGAFGIAVVISLGLLAWGIENQVNEREVAGIYLNAAEQERARAEAELGEEIARSAPLLERERWAGEVAVQEAIDQGRVDAMYADAFLDLVNFQEKVTLESLHYARTGETVSETKHQQEVELKEMEHRHWMQSVALVSVLTSIIILAFISAVNGESLFPLVAGVVYRLADILESNLKQSDRDDLDDL